MAKALNTQELAEKFGYAAAFIEAYPEIKTLMQKAVSEGWNETMFQARFKNTNWYKTHSESQQKAAIMQYSDPAEWGALWNRTQMHIIAMMGQMGGNTGDWNTINSVASKMIWEGWSDERAQQEIGMHLTFGAGGMAGGKAGEAQAELFKYMYDMGVKNSDAWIQAAVTDIVSGRKSMQDYKNQVMNQAAAAFPGYLEQFKTGATLSDLAQPYLQSMSQILEIAPGQVNLFDPTVRNAMNYKGSDGKVTTKPLWQFQNELRSDDRWKKTQNAQDAAMGLGHKILQDWGILH